MYTTRIILSLFALLLLAVFIDSFVILREAVDNQRIQEERRRVERLLEVEKHCKMKWGESHWYDDCVKGLTITPRSGMLN